MGYAGFVSCVIGVFGKDMRKWKNLRNREIFNMRHLAPNIYLFTVFIIGSITSASANEPPVDPIKTIGPAMIRVAEAKNNLLNALAAAENVGDIPKIGEVIDQVAEAMTAAATEAEKWDALTAIQKRELQAIGERREYELFQDRSMESAIEKIPADIQPKVITLLESRREQMTTIEKIHDKVFAINERKQSHSFQAHSLALEQLFFANISFGNETDPRNDPLQFVVVSVEVVNPAEQSSLILYRQEVEWKGQAPDEESLKPWIKWNPNERKVVFILPENRFEYVLPKVDKP